MRTSCLSSRCFVAGETASAGTEVMRVRKLLLKPTAVQQRKLWKWAHAARWTYNRSVERLHADNTLSDQDLRNQLVTAKDNEYVLSKPWLLQTPKVIRQQAAFKAKAAQKTGFANLRAKNIRHFKLRFQMKKGRTWSLGVERQLHCKDGVLKILPRELKAMRYKGKVPFEGKPPVDCILHHTEDGRFYLCVPEKDLVTVLEERQEAVALDPGARKFLTSFSSEGACHALGANVTPVIEALLNRLDVLREHEQRSKAAKKRRLRRARLKVYKRLKNLQDELHSKICCWLTDNFDTIVMPTFNVHTIANREDSRLIAKTKRVFFALAHGRFRQRLKNKCLARGCILLEPDERYTTKTCGLCGQLNNVGSSETFRCQECGACADRDANASRNILLKCMETFSIT